MSPLKICFNRQFLALLIFSSVILGNSINYQDGLGNLSFEKGVVQYPPLQDSPSLQDLSTKEKQHLVYTETESLSESELDEKFFLPSQSTTQLVYSKLSKLCNILYSNSNDAVQKCHGVPLYDMYCSRRYHLS